MAFSFMIPLRAVQAVFAIIVLGLTAYVASGASPASDNFLVFTSVWTLLALIYLAVVPTFVPKASHKFAILAVEALTTLFWFAGFIALAVFLGDRVCHGHVCAAAKAATVFAAFTWALFMATLVLLCLEMFGGRGRATNSKPDHPVNVNSTV